MQLWKYSFILFALYSCNVPEKQQNWKEEWKQQQVVKITDADFIDLGRDWVRFIQQNTSSDSVSSLIDKHKITHYLTGNHHQLTGKKGEVIESYKEGFKRGQPLPENFQLLEEILFYTTPVPSDTFALACYEIPRKSLADFITNRKLEEN